MFMVMDFSPKKHLKSDVKVQRLKEGKANKWSQP